MFDESLRPAWAEINLDALEHNIQSIINKVGPDKEVFAVIKADGYGHGSVALAEILIQQGIKTVAVATLQEAITLRDGGIDCNILMLGLTPSVFSDIVAQYDITPVLNSYINAQAMDQAARKLGKKMTGFIAVDTGMGRVGYLADDLSALEEIKAIQELENFQIAGIFSHFATADALDKTFANEQIDRFNAFYEALTNAGIHIPKRTFANSAAIMELPRAHYDAVRPGIVLYGCYPSDEVDKSQLDILPVMSVKANIVRLKRVPIGFSVGYGRKFIAKRESLIATITLGYADGYPRPYSGVAQVIVGGVKAPIAGNICMDQCMIDVTDVPDVKVGDAVIIMGSDGKNTILADDIAKATGTINYEIVCAFGQRLPKVYLSNGSYYGKPIR